MGIIRSCFSFIAGTVCGIYVAQNYKVPNVAKLADTALFMAKVVEETYRKPSKKGYFGVYLADVEGFEADEAFEVVGEGAEAVEAIVKDLERGEVERGRKRSLLEFTFSFFSFLSSKPMLSGSCISLLKLAFSSSNDPQL
ncbi:hypothetical protein AHAS_Ahas19G0069500 [Arachis hypogaea]